MINKYCNSTVGTILYLSVPIIVFFLTWLHWYIAIPTILMLGVAAYQFVINVSSHFSKVEDRKNIAVVASVSIIIFIYLLSTGHGGFVGSIGYDIPWRNAIYHDLICQSWPVIYEYSHSALVYYITFWLVPAGISSLFGFGEWGSNVILFLWTYIGLLLFMSLLRSYLKVSQKQLIVITLIFLFWSGLNIIGMFIVDQLGFMNFRLDSEWGWEAWWYTGISYDGIGMAYMVRTVFDGLSNTYHQFVPTLLATILFLKYRDAKSIIFIDILLLPYSPFGFVGLFLLIFPELLKQGIKFTKMSKFKQFMKQVFCLDNVLLICSVLPVFFFYFIVNASSENISGSVNGSVGNYAAFLSAPLTAYGSVRIFVLCLYYIFYFWVFMIFCFRYCKDKFLFWSVIGSLFIIPFFKIGLGTDFCYNASVPGFYIIMIFMMRECLRLGETRITIRTVTISLIMVLAFVTPVLQMASAYKKCVRYESIVVNYDHAKLGGTFSNKSTKEVSSNLNFIVRHYDETVFFKYLSKI